MPWLYSDTCAKKKKNIEIEDGVTVNAHVFDTVGWW